MNIVRLGGELTRDPDLRYTNNGTAVCNFGLAADNDVNRSRAFITVTAWEKDAEHIAENYSKGSRFDFEGMVNTRTYEDNRGKTVWVTEFTVNEILGEADPEEPDEPEEPEEKPKPKPKPKPKTKTNNKPKSSGSANRGSTRQSSW